MPKQSNYSLFFQFLAENPCAQAQAFDMFEPRRMFDENPAEVKRLRAELVSALEQVASELSRLPLMEE